MAQRAQNVHSNEQMHAASNRRRDRCCSTRSSGGVEASIRSLPRSSDVPTARPGWPSPCRGKFRSAGRVAAEDLSVMVWPASSYLCGWMSSARHTGLSSSSVVPMRAPENVAASTPRELDAHYLVLDDHEIEIGTCRRGSAGTSTRPRRCLRSSPEKSASRITCSTVMPARIGPSPPMPRHQRAAASAAAASDMPTAAATTQRALSCAHARGVDLA